MCASARTKLDVKSTVKRKIVTLFGGSSESGDPAFSRAAYEFGRLVAREGWVLRTGAGSGKSVMGQAADGALAEGGRVEGVILAKFWGIRHQRLHRLRSERTFARRKAGLIHRTNAVVIFPGGIGTLDELGEILVLKQNEFSRVPVVLVNLRGYYNLLLRWFQKAVRSGLLRSSDLGLFSTVRTPQEAWAAVTSKAVVPSA